MIVTNGLGVGGPLVTMGLGAGFGLPDDDEIQQGRMLHRKRKAQAQQDEEDMTFMAPIIAQYLAEFQ